MPRILSDADVADFRERLCNAGEDLFARLGPDAVTIRQLARAVGVSPMTPYRYFRDKDDILALVRTRAFNAFAETLEAAFDSITGALEQSQAVGRAYLDFAFANPRAYKLMFDLDLPLNDAWPDLTAASDRARRTQVRHVQAMLDAHLITGEADALGQTYWAILHGGITLEMAGQIPSGSARAIANLSGAALTRGLHARA